VSCGAARSGSKIFLTHAGAVGLIGVLHVGQIVDNESFDMFSSSSTDSSPVSYWIIN
jgi:hypothetical protein